MITNKLLDLIGKPTKSVRIAGRYGNATYHEHGWWSLDPCYLSGDDMTREISQAHTAEYPWENRDYKKHNREWMPFQYKDQTLYARSCSDGEGYFGNCVDSGWVVVLPDSLMPQEVKNKLTTTELIK